MKKFILIIGLLILSINVKSQVLITLIFGDKLNTPDLEFGLEGGMSWSRISGMDSQSFLQNWDLGFYFDIRIKNQWFLYTGVLVKATLGLDKLTTNDLDFLGTDTYPDNGNYAQKINYFLIPALINYKFKSRIYLEAGPQFGLRTKAWVEYEADIDGKDAIIKEFNKDAIKRLDVGILGGAGYRFSERITGWTIGVKYYYGFVDVYKNRSGTKNNTIFLKLNVPIGAGEKAKAKNAKKAAEKEEKKKAKEAKKLSEENN